LDWLKRMTDAVAYMEEHLAEPFEIAALARVACSSVFSLPADVSHAGRLHGRGLRAPAPVDPGRAGTARLLPCCEFEARENDVHFSNEVLDDFIRTVMVGIDGN